MTLSQLYEGKINDVETPFYAFGGDILQNSGDYNMIKYTKNSTFYYFELFNFCKVRFYRNHKIITLYKMHEK